MNTSNKNLSAIEEAISSPNSPLSKALTELGAQSSGVGTCLVIQHEEFGEALIADGNWAHGREETIELCDDVALVDLHEGFGFKRLAILVEPSQDAGPSSVKRCAMAVAALSVTEELARIATSWLAMSKVPAAGILGSVSAA